MRHGKKINSLSRKAEHRNALLSNLSKSLITHKRIQTTLAKAKSLRKYVEPLITKAKYDSTHARRTVFSYLQDKEAVKELFITVADKVGDRPGGYTRIIKMGSRLGDGAETALIELVDFNENLLGDKSKSSGRRRRRRGGRSRGSGGAGEQQVQSGSTDTAEQGADDESTTSSDDQQDDGDDTGDSNERNA